MMGLNMSRIVYVNGNYLPEEDAKLSVFDRGFLFADAVYEVTTVINGKLIDFAGHMERLKRSLGELDIKPPATSAADQHWEASKLLSEAEVAQRYAIRLIDVWNTEIEPLQIDENGDVVAANKDFVQKLAYVFSKQRAKKMSQMN